jgi:hypothetical protein
MDDRRSAQPRMPIAEDVDDVVQLRTALLDRDRRLVRLRAELVGMQRWVGQLQSQVDELSETVDNARASLEFTITTAPDLLEPEVEELVAAVAIDERAARAQED